ncbi:MAG: peptide/nickel transport system permease protein [Flavobacteriaceae bacterium]
MEFKRALYRFKQDFWAVGSLLFIIVVTLIAVFAYPLAPDKTEYGNQMHLSIHSQPPGFSCEMLIIPRGGEKQLFLSGNINPNEEIPVQDIQWFENELAYKRYGNATDYYEKIPFSDFSKAATRSQIETNYLKKKRFILGTDKYGRDLLSRLLIGSRISISIGFVAVFISLVLGVFLGAIAGYFGSWIDRIVMWLINIIWSIPTLLMVIAITLALGRGFWQVFVAVGLTMWVEVARLVRGQVKSVKEQLYIQAGAALGFSHIRILFIHILPMLIAPLIVISAANFASAILMESGLSFLGIGAQPPMPSWGGMVKDHFRYLLLGKPYLAVLPGLAIMSLVLAFMMLGNSLRDAFDVKR